MNTNAEDRDTNQMDTNTQPESREAARIKFHERRELETNEHDFAFLDGYDAGLAARASSPAAREPINEEGPSLGYIKQEEPLGCGIAILAMLTGQSYKQVRDDLLAEMERPNGFVERGIDFEVVNEYLRRKGYAVAKLWTNCPMTNKPEPNFPRTFGPIHYANVEQHSGNWHFVVVTKDGTILDPLVGEVESFDQYSRVGSITAVYPMGASSQEDER